MGNLIFRGRNFQVKNAQKYLPNLRERWAWQWVGSAQFYTSAIIIFLSERIYFVFCVRNKILPRDQFYTMTMKPPSTEGPALYHDHETPSLLTSALDPLHLGYVTMDHAFFMWPCIMNIVHVPMNCVKYKHITYCRMFKSTHKLQTFKNSFQTQNIYSFRASPYSSLVPFMLPASSCFHLFFGTVHVSSFHLFRASSCFQFFAVIYTDLLVICITYKI